MNTLKQRIEALSLFTHIVLAVLIFVACRLSNIVLDNWYARSQFPVPFQEGQTAFSGDLIKSYYQTMIDAGTLNIYWQTQLIDFAFIGSMFALGLILPLLIRRAYRSGGFSYRVTSWAALFIPLGAAFDAVENLISFVMLAQPLTFPNWIAPIYSSFAVMKFGAIGLGFVCLMIGIIWFVASWIGRRIRGVVAIA